MPKLEFVRDLLLQFLHSIALLLRNYAMGRGEAGMGSAGKASSLKTQN